MEWVSALESAGWPTFARLCRGPGSLSGKIFRQDSARTNGLEKRQPRPIGDPLRFSKIARLAAFETDTSQYVFELPEEEAQRYVCA